MKTTLIRYGSIAALVWLVQAGTAFALAKAEVIQSFDYGKLIGYSSMVLTLSVIFFALIHYRDQVNGGRLSFGEGMGLGLGISTIAGVVVALWDYAYTTWLQPDFVALYTEWYKKKALAAGKAAEVAQREIEKMATDIEQMGGNLGMALLMFVTVLLLGLLISLVATLLLRRSQPAA